MEAVACHPPRQAAPFYLDHDGGFGSLDAVKLVVFAVQQVGDLLRCVVPNQLGEALALGLRIPGVRSWRAAPLAMVEFARLPRSAHGAAPAACKGLRVALVMTLAARLCAAGLVGLPANSVKRERQARVELSTVEGCTFV
jgi:hypothetical protein